MENTEIDTLTKAIDNISFDGPGEYGLHDNFFNAVTEIDGVEYDFQGCADDNNFDPDDCGHDDGICGDANDRLAKKLMTGDDDLHDGYCKVQILLKKAWEIASI